MDVRVADPQEIPLCLALRHEVFVEEQRVPLHEDADDLDAIATHFVAWVGADLVGTARLRLIGPGVAKAERVAVKASLRSRGIGARVMAVLEAEATRAGCKTVKLHAQESAIAFYLRLGYVAYGPRFLDADIWHRAMEKVLT